MKIVLRAITCCAVSLVIGFTSTSTSADINVVELTIQDIAASYAAGEFTAVELTQAYLDRIHQFEPNYNAFTFFNPDSLADAAALDEERAANGPRGPLHGVPIVIKESMDFVGLPSTMGYAGFSSLAGGVELDAGRGRDRRSSRDYARRGPSS